MLNRESAFRGWRFCPVCLIFLGLDHFRQQYLDLDTTSTNEYVEKVDANPTFDSNLWGQDEQRVSAFRGWRFCPVSLIFLGLDHFRIKYLDANCRSLTKVKFFTDQVRLF